MSAASSLTNRRNEFTRHAPAPLEGRLSASQFEQLVAALGVGWGTEAVISLIDVGQLAPDTALDVMRTTCRWILDDALADAGLHQPTPQGASVSTPIENVPPQIEMGSHVDLRNYDSKGRAFRSTKSPQAGTMH